MDACLSTEEYWHDEKDALVLIFRKMYVRNFVLKPEDSRPVKFERSLMKDRSVILTMILATGLLVASCAPVVTPAPGGVEPPPQAVVPSATPFKAAIAPSPAVTTGAAQPTEEPAKTPGGTPQAVATSRGEKLEATSPSTVALASGGLQLVEFFRFT